jgi:hypothetical protein
MAKLKKIKNEHKDNIPEKFDSIEAAAEFWDSHDVTDYFELTKEVSDVKIELVRKYFKIERNLAKKLSAEANKKGISSEALINLWLQEKLFQTAKSEH